MSLFKKAERKQAKLKLALSGPSGAGKTYSSLLIAKGIGGKIALLDTENHSASLYADRFDFDICEIDPPYTTDKYIQAIKAAEKENYSVIIIDSITHQWAGEGGILDKKAAMDSRAGSNSYTNWKSLTPEQEKFKAAILQCDAHVICTMRSKQEYAMNLGENGKNKVQKLGMAPIQRDGMEYEFTCVFDLAMNHSAEASKDRTGLFDSQIFKPSEETGNILLNWLMTGKPVWKFGDEQLKHIKQLADLYGWDGRKTLQVAGKKLEELNEDEYNKLCEQMTSTPQKNDQKEFPSWMDEGT